MLTEITWSAPKDFLTLSSALTGFTTADLQGTGLVDTYYNQTLDVIGSRITGMMLLKWSQMRPDAGTFNPLDSKFKPRIQTEIFEDGLVGPVARNVLLMWYTGNWYQMPGSWRMNYGASAGDQPHVVSAEAYQEGLMWRAIAAHPPAAKSPGYGSWAEPPKSANEA